jgi:hypothetical protein
MKRSLLLELVEGLCIWPGGDRTGTLWQLKHMSKRERYLGWMTLTTSIHVMQSPCSCVEKTIGIFALRGTSTGRAMRSLKADLPYLKANRAIMQIINRID